MQNQPKKANRIGIDMRMAVEGEGIGRYITQLVRHLAEIDQQNQYFLLLPASVEYQMPGENFQPVRIASLYYSFAEQTKFIAELQKLNLDLVHFASFNAPILYNKRFIVTIHDLIHHHFPGKKKSRIFHRLAYKIVMRSAVKKAQRIITVSKATKADLQTLYDEPGERFTVVYEGVDKNFRYRLNGQELARVQKKYGLEKPYLLFVGVWRQYKNLPNLAKAFDILKDELDIKELQLLLVGKADPFYQNIKQQIFSAKYSQDIKALGYVADQDMPALYQGANLFVLPSLLEGFGLIGIEAQAARTPVAASNIPVLKEVLGDGAIYFNPHDPAGMARVMKKILTDNDFVNRLSKRGFENSVKYNWATTAKQTLNVYSQVLDEDR